MSRITEEQIQPSIIKGAEEILQEQEAAVGGTLPLIVLRVMPMELVSSKGAFGTGQCRRRGKGGAAVGMQV